MAAQLINSSVTDYFEFSKDIAIYEIEVPEDMQGYTLSDLELRERYNVNLLTIKRSHKGGKVPDASSSKEMETLGVLHSSTKLQPNDLLVVMGTEKNINKLIDTN